MGRLNADMLRYMSSFEFRLLTAVEMGMKNHEVVSIALIASIANSNDGNVFKTLCELCKNRLLAYEKTSKFVVGYRLTRLGYDYLALRALASKGIIVSLGRQIGVGKEADVYLAATEEGETVCLKFHRLGRTSFRRIKIKRDYHKNRSSMSWLYLSRLAAEKEFTFMSALGKADFPVPRVLDVNRHVIVMAFVDASPLSQINEIAHPMNVWQQLAEIAVRMAEYGLVHSDFNEFNIMVDDNEKVTVIDFPQCVSIAHTHAEKFFDHDLSCLASYFVNKYRIEITELPEFGDIARTGESLDLDLKASGYRLEMDRRLKDADSDGEESDSDEETIGSDSDSDDIDCVRQKQQESDVDTAFRKLNMAPEVCNRDLSADLESMQSYGTSVATSVPPEQIRERVKKQLSNQRKSAQSKNIRKTQRNDIRVKSKRDLCYTTKDIVKSLDGWI